MATVLYAICIAINVRLNPHLIGNAPQQTSIKKWQTTRKAWPVAAMFAIVFGGIQFGIYSPTKAAAVGAAGAVLLALWRRSLDRNSLISAMRETIELTGMIFFIIVGAALFNFFIETTGLPQYLIAAVENSGFSPLAILMLIILFFWSWAASWMPCR